MVVPANYLTNYLRIAIINAETTIFWGNCTIYGQTNLERQETELLRGQTGIPLISHVLVVATMQILPSLLVPIPYTPKHVKPARNRKVLICWLSITNVPTTVMMILGSMEDSHVP